MPGQLSRIERLRRRWYRWCGEEYLLAALWPHDYERGLTYRIGKHGFRVTRYLRAPNHPYIEVWGRASGESAAAWMRHEHSL